MVPVRNKLLVMASWNWSLSTRGLCIASGPFELHRSAKTRAVKTLTLVLDSAEGVFWGRHTSKAFLILGRASLVCHPEGTLAGTVLRLHKDSSLLAFMSLSRSLSLHWVAPVNVKSK